MAKFCILTLLKIKQTVCRSVKSLQVIKRQKIMKTIQTICQYLLGIILIIVGLLAWKFEEPLYGLGIILLGLLILPIVWSLLNKVLKREFSAKLKMGVTIGLALAIIIGLYAQGRKDYGLVESITDTHIQDLSTHPVKTIKINDLAYYYIEEGKGEAVFLLHGFPDMANTWDQTITELSRNHRVIAPFLRGYYPTGIPKDGQLSVKLIADDIVKIAETLGIEKFTVVGQDWGASIAYATANLAPKKVIKIVALAIPHPSCIELTPELLMAGRHFIVFSNKNWAIRYTRKNDFEYIDRLYKRWSPDFVNYKESSDAIKETFKYPGRLEAALGYYISLAEDQTNENTLAFYATLPKVPVLFLGGENDKGVTDTFISNMKERMPAKSRVVILKNAGHFLHREVFKDFITELEAFING